MKILWWWCIQEIVLFYQQKMSEINLKDFTEISVDLRLWKTLYILKKPTVKQFTFMLDEAQNMGQGDFVKDIQIMISILVKLLDNQWFLWIRKRKFNRLLHSLDYDSILIIREKTFLELGVDRLIVPTQPEPIKRNEV